MYFVNGLPISEVIPGALVMQVTVSTPDHWCNGWPRNSDGSIAVELEEPVVYRSQGLPYTTLGAISAVYSFALPGEVGGVDNWIHGWPIMDGFVAITDDALFVRSVSSNMGAYYATNGSIWWSVL